MIWNFQTLRWKWSAPADRFRCKVRWDRRASVARGAAPCSEQSDAKQPGHLAVRTVRLAERTYSRQESIEVRPCYQGIFHHSHSSAAYSFANSSGQRTSQRVCSASKVQAVRGTASEVPHPTNETGMIRNVIGRRTPSAYSSVRVKPTQKISFVIAIAPPCLSVESPCDSGRVSAFSVARRCAWE